MKLSKEAIEEYKETYKKAFGREISDKEAEELAFELLTLFKLIYKPIPKDKIESMKRIVREYEEMLKKTLV